MLPSFRSVSRCSCGSSVLSATRLGKIGWARTSIGFDKRITNAVPSLFLNVKNKPCQNTPAVLPPIGAEPISQREEMGFEDPGAGLPGIAPSRAGFHSMSSTSGRGPIRHEGFARARGQKLGWPRVYREALTAAQPCASVQMRLFLRQPEERSPAREACSRRFSQAVSGPRDCRPFCRAPCCPRLSCSRGPDPRC